MHDNFLFPMVTERPKSKLKFWCFISGFVLAGFSSWPCARKIIPLGNLLSPNFGIFKVQGRCPKMFARHVCPHCPKIDSGYFLCTMYARGWCPFLGMEIYSEKSLAPRNLSGINLGTTLRRHHTRGSGFVLAGFFFLTLCPKNYPSRTFIQPQLWYFQSSGWLSHWKIFSDTGLQPKKSVEFLGAEFVGDLQRDK